MMKQRLYRSLSGLVTADDARRKYMNPQLINRANARMSREELSALIVHHADELQSMLDHYFRSFATGQHVGRVTKKRLAKLANQLHDCWNAIDLHKGTGRPILWEA